VNPPRCFPVRLFRGQLQPHVDAPDHQDIRLKLNFTNGFRHQPPARCIDLTRLQRASQGSGQSTSRGRYDVIESRSVRLSNRRRNFIVLGNGAVYAKDYGLRLSGQPCSANRTLDPFDANFRPVGNARHRNFPQRRFYQL
jgi:hypothetical protein